MSYAGISARYKVTRLTLNRSAVSSRRWPPSSNFLGMAYLLLRKFWLTPEFHTPPLRGFHSGWAGGRVVHRYPRIARISCPLFCTRHLQHAKPFIYGLFGNAAHLTSCETTRGDVLPGRSG